ncbi:hypothetical protein Tco_1166584 [Tanacetum coccineum]
MLTKPQFFYDNTIKQALVIWERVHDFQLGIESYQQKVNLTAPTISFPGVEKHKMFSIIYESVHGIIYKNSKKEKRVMRHSEIHKFCDATLNRVLEGLKSYNNDVKYGYIQRDLTNDEVEYLKLFEEEIELVRNQCIVTNHQVNVQFVLQLKPEWQRFMTIVKQSQDSNNVSNYKLYDILKQHYNEVNEIRDERLAHTANPLALVAQQQPVYHPQTNPTHYTQGSSTRSQDATRNRGTSIANSPQPTYDLVVADDDTSSKEKETNKLMALISMSRGTGYDKQTRQYDTQRIVNVVGARANIGTQVVQQTEISCYNYKEFGHVVRECQKLKRARDLTYYQENMLLCKQEEAGIQLSAEQVDRRNDTDDEPEDQELEAHYMYMAKIQEVTPDAADNSGPIFDAEPLQKVHNFHDDYNVFANERQHPKQLESVNDTYLMEQCDTSINSDSSDMSNNSEEADQDDQMFQKERELLASLIEQLKVEINVSKQDNKSLESSNKALKEANTFLQSELTRYQDTDFVKNAREKCETAYGLLEEQKVKPKKSSSAYSEKILSLNKKISELENELSAHK